MNTTLAQIYNPLLPANIGGSKTLTTDQGPIAAGGFISSIISLLFIVSLVFTLMFLVLGGIQWITSGGDKAALEGARNRITNGILGLIIVAAAWAIWLLVGKFLGINVESLPFPTLG